VLTNILVELIISMDKLCQLCYNNFVLKKDVLTDFYVIKKMSMQEIADCLGCSLHKVFYWIDKHDIKTRSRSEATYLKRNPRGDPFSVQRPKTNRDFELVGMGLGLF